MDTKSLLRAEPPLILLTHSVSLVQQSRSCARAALKISIPHKKLLKDVITSLCICSIAALYRLAKSFTSGSTSAMLTFSELVAVSSADNVKARLRCHFMVQRQKGFNVQRHLHLPGRVLTNLIKSLKCSWSNSSCRNMHASHQETSVELLRKCQCLNAYRKWT